LRKDVDKRQGVINWVGKLHLRAVFPVIPGKDFSTLISGRGKWGGKEKGVKRKSESRSGGKNMKEQRGI